MKKNDKLIVLAGVAILIIASIGIYYWSPGGTTGATASKKTLFSAYGTISKTPTAMTVSDSNPFYALVATPLAVHYDREGKEQVIPLYVENITNPSRSIVRAQNMIGKPINLLADGSKTPEELSIYLAKNYWSKSDGVLLIRNNQEGYNLGVVATPIASYLSIPIIVTDKIDSSITSVLRDLGVKYSIICGNLSGFGNYIKFEKVDDIVNFSIDLVKNKFGDVGYITLTNPLDAWRPEILNRTFYSPHAMEISSSTTTQLPRMILGMVTGKSIASYTFTIPKDYKYALVKIEVVNLDPDGVDEFGDSVAVQGGIDDKNAPENFQAFELASYGVTSASNPALRDASGKVIKDRAYQEVLLYDRGGKNYTLQISGTWLAKKSGRVQLNIEVDKLANIRYAMMKDLSSVAPYLTAYHHGIIFAKTDFAFYPDDNVLTEKGQTCPGYYSVRKNPKLAYAHDLHVFNKIHKPLNNLLAKIANIPVNNLKNLRNYYKNNPIYIAVVGDAEMLPRIMYNNYISPLREDVSPYSYAYGLGTPSDFIYGNIDPIPNDWSNLANDTYSYYPYQENIVGRLAGWDAQDVDAQIVRTIFYYDIINKLGDWKDKATVLVGGGQDFQKPPLRYALAKLTGGGEEPLKLPTGYGKIGMERTKEKVLKPMGFDVTSAYDCEAQSVGFSNDALSKIKKANLMNRLLFSKNYVAKYLGENVAKGKKYMENSNFIWANGHGNPYLFGMPGPSAVAMGIGGPLVKTILERILPCLDGGFFGPGFSLTAEGEYNVRQVEKMNLGPSFIWIDSCLCGKIGGVYPQNSISMAFVHAGANAIISSPMESNIGGGYLEPKNHKYDTPWSVARAYLNTTRNAKNGEYPEPHFAYLMYKDMTKELMNNKTIGLAFRDAKDAYLPEDANWTIWWSPPLITTGNPFLDLHIQNQRYNEFEKMYGSEKAKMIKNKYFEFQEFCLYGDPAFNPYVPGEAS